MRTIRMSVVGLAISVGLWGASGCAEHPSVERVLVPAPGSPDVRRYEWDRARPLPADAALSERMVREMPAPPFEDGPLVSQRTPEQGRFEQAYRAVGRPRITVFINRGADGQIAPAGNGTVERETDGRRTNGVPGGYTREVERTRLKTGDYDEAYARSLDYGALENILTDVLACQGAVEIISPAALRNRLTPEQIRDAQAGQPRGLREAAAALETDVIVQVTAQPTRQTGEGLQIRLVGEAVNVKGGQQIGRAMVDVPVPMEKTTINKYGRWVGRKLMADMTAAWSSAEPARGAPDGVRPGDQPRSEQTRPETPRIEQPKNDVVPPRLDPPKVEPSTPDAPKIEGAAPGVVQPFVPGQL